MNVVKCKRIIIAIIIIITKTTRSISKGKEESKPLSVIHTDMYVEIYKGAKVKLG